LNLGPENIDALRILGVAGVGSVGSQAGKNAVGASIYIMVAKNTTTTTVGSGAQIYTAMPAAAVQTFTPTSVDTTTNTIDLGYDHAFTTGEPLFYDNSGSPDTDIGGLQRGHVYYAIVDPSQPTKLRLAASLADATAITAVPVTLLASDTDHPNRGYGSGHSFTPAALSVTAETTNLEVSLAASGGAAAEQGVAGGGLCLGGSQHQPAAAGAAWPTA